jgi:hypothetical protein
MRVDHPLATARQVTLSECAAYPVVMLADAWLLDAASENEFVRSGAQFNARITSNSLGVMKETMKAGLGLGFFTPTGFVDEIMTGGLVHVPLAEPGLAASEIGLFVHRTRCSAHHISIVADELKREFKAAEEEITAMPRRPAWSAPVRLSIAPRPPAQLWRQFYDLGQKTGRIGALADMDLKPPRLKDGIEIRAKE